MKWIVLCEKTWMVHMPLLHQWNVFDLYTVYSKRHSNVLGGHEARPCKFITFEVADKIGTLESGNLSKSCVTEVRVGVTEIDSTRGGLSTLDANAKKRADDWDGGRYEFSSGDGAVQIPPVESVVGQERVSRGKDRYYPGQSAGSLLTIFFELNPPTHPDLCYPTTSFSADQMIQFARSEELEVSLPSHGRLKNLFLKEEWLVVNLLRRVIPLEYPRFQVLLGPAWEAMSPQGLFICRQLSQIRKLVMFWWVRGRYRGHAPASELIRL